MESAAISSQLQQIRLHLKHHHAITSWEAFELFGITRLSAIIYTLRKTHNIVSVPMTATNRYGNTVNFVKYVYEGEKDDAEV